MLDNGLVSIIIPTYKRAYRLDKAIDSVLSQSYKNIEVIVVDDNNNGDQYRLDTERLMKKYSGNEKVVYIQHPKNLNGSAARNTGILQSKGVFVGFLDDDDLFLPQKIERQVLNLIDNPTYDAVCCAHISRYKNYVYKRNRLIEEDNGNQLYLLLSGQNVLAAGSTLLIRRRALDILKGFDVSFTRHQDWEFLVRFFRFGKMSVINDRLVIVNVDGERNYPKADDFLAIKLSFLNCFKEDIAKESQENIDDIYRHQIREVVLVYWKQGSFRKGCELIKRYKSNFRVDFKFLVISLYSILESKIKFMQPLKYKIMSLKYFRK